MDLKQLKLKEIRPQPGPQTAFAECEADIAIVGGSAFGGKTYSLLLDPLRAIHHPRFNGIFFRREMPEISAGGGPWDTSNQIYPVTGGHSTESRHKWIWQSGASMKFSHLQLESDVMSHHSAAYVYIAFDELVTFTEKQFWYLHTRNRPPAGYQGRCWMRAGTNPDADSWLRDLIDWWIGPDGYPLEERSGILRYFTRKDDKVIWVDKDWRDPDGNPPKSFTFIPAPIDFNVIGNDSDPTYKSNLYAQDLVTRERLLKGNWNISYLGGMFNSNWFDIVDPDTIPANAKRVRYWDFAATPKDAAESSDPDWTAGVKIAYTKTEIWIEDVERLRETPGVVEGKVKQVAALDGLSVAIGLEEEKGSSGKYVGDYYKRTVLPRYEVYSDAISGSKIERAKPVAALAEKGHVHIIAGRWNRDFLAEIGSFPLHKRDQVDALSGCYKLANMQQRVWPTFNRGNNKYYRSFVISWENYWHYGAVFATSGGVLHVLTAVWKRAEMRLYVYGELSGPQLSIAQIARAIVNGMSYKDRIVTGLFGNDEMFAPGRSAAVNLNTEIHRICKDISVPCKATCGPPAMYDRTGAITRANLMFHSGEIVVHEACVEAGKQFSSWTLTDGKPDPHGYPFCECLCLIVDELNRVQQIEKKKKWEDPNYKPRRKEKPMRQKMNSYQIA